MLVASVGVNFAAVRLFETSMEDANTIYLVGYHITDVIGLTMGIPIILLRITLGLCDDILRRGIGALFMIIGACHLISLFVTETDALAIAAWIGMFIVSIAWGIIVLRGRGQE